MGDIHLCHIHHSSSSSSDENSDESKYRNNENKGSTDQG